MPARRYKTIASPLRRRRRYKITLTHKLRVLVSGLKGEARQAELLRLLTNPTTINRRLSVRLYMLRTP